VAAPDAYSAAQKAHAIVVLTSVLSLLASSSLALLYCHPSSLLASSSLSSTGERVFEEKRRTGTKEGTDEPPLSLSLSLEISFGLYLALFSISPVLSLAPVLTLLLSI